MQLVGLPVNKNGGGIQKNKPIRIFTLAKSPKQQLPRNEIREIGSVLAEVGRMKANQLAVVAVVPLFAGFLLAQEPSTGTQSPATQSTGAQTATATTWNGTLVDAGCRSAQSKSDDNAAKSKTT